MSLGLFWVSLWPAYREALSANHHHWAFRIFRKSTLLAAVYAAGFGLLIALLFEPATQLWIGHPIKVGAVLIWGYAIWHILEAVGTSVAILLSAASIVRIQVLLAISFSLPCLLIKATLAANDQIEFLPWATLILYFILSLTPLFLTRARIYRLIHENPL